MSIYAQLPKLGRFQMPSGTVYALTDADLRLMVAPAWSANSTYKVGDYVRYDANPYANANPASDDPFHASDDLYKCKEANSDASWTASKWEQVTITDELRDIWDSITSAINYRGKTTTSLKDGAPTNPIVINNTSYTATAGDLVIETPPTFTQGTTYYPGEYFQKSGVIYQVEKQFTAGADLPTSDYINVATSEPEFIFDGTSWAEFGAFNPSGLGDLAYKDSASGTYVKPTGSGSVNVPTVTQNTKSLSTTTITTVDGTVNASLVEIASTKSFATAGSAQTLAIAATDATRVGNADVGDSIGVGTALGGTTSFNTDAIKSATLTGTKTFNTDAIKSASLTGTTTFATSGLAASVDGDCLIFDAAGTGTVGIQTSAASTGTVGIETATATTASVSLTTTNITPAKAVSSTSTTVTGVSGTVTITPVAGTADAITQLTITPVTPAKAASSTTTVATGSLKAGNQLLESVTIGSASATVTVGTTNDTVTVK